MQDTAFQPTGPTYSISGSPVQVLSFGQTGTSYRIRNLVTSVSIISWSPALASGNAPAITSVAPTLGVPSTNTIGMIGSSVEVFRLPQSVWFASGSGNAFEVTPGEGI